VKSLGADASKYVVVDLKSAEAKKEDKKEDKKDS
jgi:hypothetical protein